MDFEEHQAEKLHQPHMSVSRPSLLLTRILQFRDLSPLLILKDSIFQSAYSLLLHFEDCARTAKIEVIRIGWSKQNEVCTMVSESGILPTTKTIDQIIQEIRSLIKSKDKVLLSIPDLNDFLATHASHLPTFLSSLIAIRPGSISVCAVYHADIPLLSYPGHLPAPETLLTYLATTIITVQSLKHVLLSLEAQRQSKTSCIELDLENQDIFTVLGSNDVMSHLTLEHRRKSGRGIRESSLYDARHHKILQISEVDGLEEPKDIQPQQQTIGEEELGFKIELSDKAKVERDGVVLPHFAAQESEERKSGTIYYEPDSGDDFDAEDPDDDLML